MSDNIKYPLILNQFNFYVSWNFSSIDFNIQYASFFTFKIGNSKTYYACSLSEGFFIQ